MRRMVFAFLLSVMAGATGVPDIAAAQGESDRCRAAEDSLVHGSTDLALISRLSPCGKDGAEALARAIRASAQEHGADRLYLLNALSGTFRSHEIVDAAIELAQTTSNLRDARVFALLVMLRQFDDRTMFGNPADALGHRCPLTSVMSSVGSYSYAEKLSPGDNERMMKAMSTIVHRPGEDPLVRAVAGCVRGVLHDTTAYPVDIGLIRLKNLCADRFVVRNGNPEWVEVRWAVSHSEEKGGLSVPPNGEALIATHARGTVRLFYLGRQIANADSRKEACP